MKLTSKHILNFSVFLFFIVLPFERQHIFFQFGYQFGNFAAVSFYASDIIALILVGIGLFRLIKNMAFPLPRELLVLFIFLIFAMITAPRGAFQSYFGLKMLEFGGIWLFFNYFSKETTVSYATLAGISVSALLQALIGIAQFIKQQSLGLKFLGEDLLSASINGVAKINTPRGTFIRAYGTFGHPNQLAAFLCVACVTSLILLRKSKNRIQTITWMSTVILLVLGETLTFSRGGWLALIIELAIFMYLSRETIANETYRRSLIIVCVAIAFSVVAAWPYLGNRITVTDSSTISRIYYDKAGLTLFSKHPVLGVGLGNLMPAVAAIESLPQAWQIQPPHNYFIIVACETGLIGLAVFLYIFISLLTKLIKKLQTGDREQQIFKYGLLSIFVAFLVLMQVDHYFYTLQQTQLLLWSVLGIISGTVLKN